MIGADDMLCRESPRDKESTMAFTEYSFAERTKAYEAWVARQTPIVRRGLALERKLMAAATIAKWNKWRCP